MCSDNLDTRSQAGPGPQRKAVTALSTNCLPTCRSVNTIVPEDLWNDDRDSGTYSCLTHLQLHTAGVVTALVLEALVALVGQHPAAGVGASERTRVAALDILGRDTRVQDVVPSGEDGCVGRRQSGEEEENGLCAEEHLCLICGSR